jgi:hypothetical protein
MEEAKPYLSLLINAVTASGSASATASATANIILRKPSINLSKPDKDIP